MAVRGWLTPGRQERSALPKSQVSPLQLSWGAGWKDRSPFLQLMPLGLLPGLVSGTGLCGMTLGLRQCPQLMDAQQEGVTYPHLPTLPRAPWDYQKPKSWKRTRGTAGWAPAPFPQHLLSIPREPRTTWTPCQGRSRAARASPTGTATTGCWSTSSSPGPLTAPPQRTPTAHLTGPCCWGEVRLRAPPPPECAPQKGSEGILAAELMAPSPHRAAGGHAGVHALPEIQASLHPRLPPTPGAMPWRRESAQGKGTPQS